MPQIRRDKALAQKAGPPCLKQPRLGRCVCDTDRRQGFVAPDVHTLRLSPRGHATRFEQDPGSMSNVRFRTLAPCVRRSAACWRQCHFELRHLAVDTDATCKNTRTHRTRCTAPRHSPRRLDPSYRHCKVATGSQHVHGLVTSAAGYPCTTALHEANVRPRHAGTPMEPRTALRAGLLQGRSLKDGAQGRSLRC